MRRRPTSPPAAVPERLARWLPDEWPGGGPESYTLWREARRSWAAANPGGPLGDVLDQMRYEYLERRRVMFGAPLP